MCREREQKQRSKYSKTNQTKIKENHDGWKKNTPGLQLSQQNRCRALPSGRCRIPSPRSDATGSTTCKQEKKERNNTKHEK